MSGVIILFCNSYMQSPFDAMNNSVCTLYLESILNTHYRSYQEILTVSNVPAGPLAPLIQRMSSPKLSPFQTMSAFSPPPISRSAYSQMCLLAVCRYPSQSSMKCADNFMYASDIPNVIGYLENNGYHILTDMTKMAYKSPVDFSTGAPGEYNRRKMIFMFKYEGK